MCNRYKERPSRVVGIANPIVAYDFDCAIMARGLHKEREIYENAKHGGKGETYQDWKDKGKVENSLSLN